MLSIMGEFLEKNKEEDKGFKCVLGDNLSLLNYSLLPKLCHAGVSIQEDRGKIS